MSWQQLDTQSLKLMEKSGKRYKFGSHQHIDSLEVIREDEIINSEKK